MFALYYDCEGSSARATVATVTNLSVLCIVSTSSALLLYIFDYYLKPIYPEFSGSSLSDIFFI